MNHTLTHTHTKLAGGWLGWIHDEVQAINFIWDSNSPLPFLNICTHIHTQRDRQTDSCTHTCTVSVSLLVSLTLFLLDYQPNLSIPSSILLIYSEWFEVAVIRCGFLYNVIAMTRSIHTLARSLAGNVSIQCSQVKITSNHL